MIGSDLRARIRRFFRFFTSGLNVSNSLSLGERLSLREGLMQASPEVECAQGAHDEEVAGQRVLAEVVVRQVKYLDGREGAEPPGKVVQLVDALRHGMRHWTPHH